MSKQHEPANIDWLDIQELAAYVLNLDEEADTEEVEEKVYEELGCDMEVFEKIVELLTPCAGIGRSPLTDELYCGFSKPVKDGRMWLVRTKVEEN